MHLWRALGFTRIIIYKIFIFLSIKILLDFLQKIIYNNHTMRERINYLLIVLALIVFSSIAFAGAVIVDFRGEPGSNKVTLRWSSMSEVNCEGFQIERSLSKTDFKKVGFVKALGNSTDRKEYQFVDKSIYKATLSRTFYYRIKILTTDNSNSVFYQIVAVTPSISGARETWGSIKALFR